MVLSVLLLAAVFGHADGILLRYKFTPGQEITYNVWATGVGNMSLSGMPVIDEEKQGPGQTHIRLNANARLSLIVRSVDEEGNGTIGLRLDTLRLQAQMADKGFHTALDFRQGVAQFQGQSKSIPAPGMQRMREFFEHLSITISPQGRLLAISGLDQLPTGNAPWDRMSTFGKIQDWQELLRSVPPAFPEEPVAIGDSWELQIPLPWGGVTAEQVPQFALQCTLKSLGQMDGHRIANIAFHGSMNAADLAVEAPGQSQEGAERTPTRIDLEEIIDGNIYFDLDSGQVRTERANVTANVKFELPLPKEAAETFEAPPSMDLSVRWHFVLSPGH